MSLEKKIKAVENLYLDLDKHLTVFKKTTQLHCTDGCFKCCLKPDIEATVLEFLPLALHLFKNNLSFEFYQKIKDSTSSVCTLLNPMEVFLQNGGCSQYHYRGFICRVFGFTFVRNKTGINVLSTCKEIKETQAEYVVHANELANSGKESIPVISYYRERLVEIDPNMGERLMPINNAILEAIVIVENYFTYNNPTSESENIAG